MQNFTGLAMHSNDQVVMESDPMDPNPSEDNDSRMHFGFDNPASNMGGMHPSPPSLTLQPPNPSMAPGDVPLLHEPMPEQPSAPLEEEYEEPESPIPLPSDSTQEKLNFISNNVTADNLRDTVQQAKVALLPEHHMWFAKYLVENRIVTQPNYHAVYHKLLRGIKRRDLDRAILHATIRHVRMLVRPSRPMESKDSKVLKNLGLWLGQFTLAQNRPLLYKDINMKELLYCAYENGKLGNVLPFVAKVLHGAKESIIFRAPNPWTMALLYALREVYDVPDLKLFLKFEVEMLVQALKLDMKTLRKANFLPKRRQPNLAESTDFVKRRAAKEQANNVRKQVDSTTPSQPKQQQQARSPNFTLPPDFPSSTVIPNLAVYLKINPNLKVKQMLSQAVDISLTMPMLRR